MGALRNLFVILFLVGTLCVFLMPDEFFVQTKEHGLKQVSQKGLEDQIFKEAYYYSFNRMGENTKIRSEKIVHEGSGGKITLLRPSGEILSISGKIDYKGEQGEIFPRIHSVHLYDGVSFRGEGIDVNSQEMFLNQK